MQAKGGDGGLGDGTRPYLGNLNLERGEEKEGLSYHILSSSLITS